MARDTWLQIRMDENEKALAEDVAAAHRVSMSELVRALIVLASENDGLARRYTSNGTSQVAEGT